MTATASLVGIFLKLEEGVYYISMVVVAINKYRASIFRIEYKRFLSSFLTREESCFDFSFFSFRRGKIILSKFSREEN